MNYSIQQANAKKGTNISSNAVSRAITDIANTPINWDAIALMFIRDNIELYTNYSDDNQPTDFNGFPTHTNRADAQYERKIDWLYDYAFYIRDDIIDKQSRKHKTVPLDKLDTALSKYLDSDGNLLPEYGWLFAIGRLF